MSDYTYLILVNILFLALLIATLVLFFRKSKLDHSQTQEIRDLERRMTDLMIGQLNEIRGSVDYTSKNVYDQVSSFTEETVRIREGLKQVQATVSDISSFQDIFKKPQLRGQWGEASLNHLLGEYFPEDFYKIQHSFSSGEQVDAVLKLPNDRLLPIDAKFPFDNFERMMKAESKEDKDLFRKKFIEDVKFKIKDISSKYILPSEGTLDRALMYIPAEAVFYEVMFNLKEEDIASYALKNKVIVASPNTVYLTLKTIIDWLRDVQLSKQTQDILKRLERIQEDSNKLVDDFRKTGSHLRNAVSSHENAEKRLSLFSQRVGRIIEGPGNLKKLNNNQEKYDPSSD